MSVIQVYADGHPITFNMQVGSRVSFVYLPQGENTTDKNVVRPVDATISKIGQRKIIAQYSTLGGFMRRQLVKRTIILFHRPLLSSVWRISSNIYQVELPEK
ncbi:hypothetical protein [Bombiscardovia coagulans]|uniref:Uncharacterized protein n=1 Tax=Bombiscardovia coagulans TaxID=686666 RepID=A0A261ESL2_9BIFI|nr:hypothetical protein [Bombiscardovia coagulans]OZG49844.1 hypothetical protein BOCO_0361 [Bombiscardovia coagulans]